MEHMCIFDNSFKIICYEKFRSAFGDYCYLQFKKMFESMTEKFWSTKECEYLEVSDFETLQRLFTYRFVDGKRRSKLFDALGMYYTKTKKAPYAD